MHGIYDGIEMNLILSFFYLLYIPLITVLVLLESTIFTPFRNSAKPIKISVFIGLVVVTFFVSRHFLHAVFKPFFAYSIVLTIYWIGIKSIKRRKRQKLNIKK